MIQEQYAHIITLFLPLSRTNAKSKNGAPGQEPAVPFIAGFHPRGGIPHSVKLAEREGME